MELIEAWILDPASEAKRYELLYGLSIAIHDYAIRHDVYKELRKQTPGTLTDTISTTYNNSFRHWQKARHPSTE